ncbi:12272_t:CDS:2 [Gigaspora rosea]|nr:12272_t:CDS:2 [Gigaspora rosea]
MDGVANQNQNTQNEVLVRSIFDGITFTPTNTEIPQQPPSFVEAFLNKWQMATGSTIGKIDILTRRLAKSIFWLDDW